ncbi:MAG: sulfatase-like hydrolase/transferase, partial [Planctomycetaceae bacterium]|nr:sulfatase-like hydrolase/transferase [Planctomycetaceae bacterium]
MRMRRVFLAAMGAVFYLAATEVSFAANAATSEKPNIILVMADDQGWGDTGYNGHPFVKTPELDAMAEDAFVFDRFYAGAPVCSPTRAS